MKENKNGTLPLSKNGSLKVELVPIPSSDNPWRTKADYENDKKRDTIRFWTTIASLIISIISVTTTALVAITSIKNAGCNLKEAKKTSI